MKKLSIMALLSILLIGCKVDIDANVNLSDLYSTKPKEIESNLIVEVGSCNDYQDSRKESSNLIEAKNTVISMFRGAKYIECYREKMDSKALFKIPLTVGGDKSSGDIQINRSETGVLLVNVSDSFVSNLNRAKNKSFIDVTPVISFTLLNDLGKDLSVAFYGIFINNKGYSAIVGTLDKGTKPKITLSNASMDHLIRDKSISIGKINDISN